MHIEYLEAQNFRNLESLKVHLEPNVVVVEGPNAQGKTNLLEALYVSATGKSFRNAAPKELVRHGEERGHIHAVFSRQGVRHEIDVELKNSRRHIRVDGKAVRQTTKLLELVNVIAFFPDDLRIAKGSPEERRRFLDRSVANHRADFVEASVAYTRALKQRNALLKADRVDRKVLQAYDQQLLDHAVVLHECRQATLDALLPRAQAYFAEIMQANEREDALSIELTNGLKNESTGLTRESFAAALDASFSRDRARGTTSVGPHRADLEMNIYGRSARSFASQGQQRALVLALKLSEVGYLKERLTSPPILLLDDVSSELDRDRTKLLFEAVGSLQGQVWISTTGAAPLPLTDSTQRLQIREGVIEVEMPVAVSV